MIRNTSPVGWPLPLLIKILYDRSLIPFIFAAVTVFLPIVALCTILDSLYYGHFPVITALNFIKVNLGDGLSNYFGTEPFHYFITTVFPLYFTVAVPFAYLGLPYYGRDALSKKQMPYMLVLVICYLGVFSLIKHKEPRFILPVLPFCFLMLGALLARLATSKSFIARITVTVTVVLFLLIELGTGLLYTGTRLRHWEAFVHLKPKEVPSMYALGVDMPYYSWTHRRGASNRTEFPLLHKDPTFVRLKKEVPYALLESGQDYNRCFELLDGLSQGTLRPAYVLLKDFRCGGTLACSHACRAKLEATGLY